MPRRVVNILSADVPRQVAATVRAIARTNNISVSEVIRQALEQWLRASG